ncbi:MAG: RecX family transcriptional regulator [Endomicrobiales bacterium]|nr:RecX family transcriptional regulator [Endomicrobiales bacterium]
MQITHILKSKKPYFEIEINNGEKKIKTTLDVISLLNLNKGKQISASELKIIEKEANISLAKLLAIKTVSKKQVSEHELTQKLSNANINERELSKIKSRLKELGFLNDSQYAKEAYALLLEKGKGPEFIDNYLSQKGIDTEIIKNAKQNTILNDNQQIKQIKTLIKKKFNFSKYDFAKLLAFFLRKGFSEDLIIKALKELGITGDENYADQTSTY